MTDSHIKTADRQMLKICLLSYRTNPHCGGQGVYIKNLSRALSARGHRVEIVSGPPDFVSNNGIPVHHLRGLDLYDPAQPFRMPSLQELSRPLNLVEWLGVSTMGFPEPFVFGVRAYRYFRRTRPDYDVVHDNQSLSYGIWAINKHWPTLATIHHPMTVDRDIAVRNCSTHWEKMKQMRWFSFIAMQKRVARKIRPIVTVSEAARRDIQSAYKIPADRFRVVPNGIDVDVFRPMPQIERRKGRIIATNSADVPLKGLAYLLMAVGRLAQTRSVRLFVVGPAPEKGLISRLICDLDLGSQVTFTGRLTEREFVRQYAKAEVAVVPSLYEGFGLPAGEAMACGLPVVSTTGGALPEVVGEAGILVPPAEPQAMADALAGLLDNPHAARSLGQAGYRRVHDHFTWSAAARRMETIYREAIDDHRRIRSALAATW